MNGIPNILSAFRIGIAPLLLYPAWLGYKDLFITMLVIALLTDAFDGFIARKLNVASTAGAKLDSLGDMAIYAVVPFCAWWLWPEIIQEEAPYVFMAVFAYFFPLITSIWKFHQIPSYHTYGAKAAAILMSISMLLLFLTEFNIVFRIAAIFQIIIAIEDIAITLHLSEPKSDVKSIWHLRESARKK